MKMKWKWKRPAAFLLAAAMIFTMSGVPAFAVETDVSGVSGNAPAECSCETHCEQEAVNPDCPVCAAENADLSACKGTEQATPLMAAAASTEGTISGDVTWENQTITTPVRLTGDTTITLKGENTITISDTAELSALEMDYRSLTIQGSGSLTVTVPDRKYGIADSAYSDTAGGKLTIKDGAKITTNGGQYGLNAKTIVIESGKLNLNSGWGIDTASLTMNGGTLYATGKYGAISNSYGKARNINSNLTVLYSENQNANTDDMSVGTADDTTKEGDVKTIYIAQMAPRASLIVGAQQGTLQEGSGSQRATFSVTGSNVKKETLQVEWAGDHTGLTAVKSSDGATITVTADSTVKEGRYKLKLTADSEAGFSPNKATATATVTVAAAPRNPITINKQPQVSKAKFDGQFQAKVWVDASLASGPEDKITYQWYVNGTEFKGTGSGSYKITLTQSDLTTTAGKDWEYSGQVYCKLSYQSYTLDTNTVPVTFNTCPHEKYTNEGKCQQCGEPCSKDVLFIRNGIPYTFEGDNPDVGFILFSGGTAYFVRDTNATLKAGNGEPANKMDITLDLQGHKVKTLDLQNFPYKSVTIKNGTINDIATSAPAVLILDSVTTSAGTLDKLFTLTVKGNCVFQHQVNFLGKTQLQGGTFQGGINAALGEEALALLADGYAFADAGSDEILNVSNVDISNRAVKVVAHTDQYHNGKCACGREHTDHKWKDGECTVCHLPCSHGEIGGDGVCMTCGTQFTVKANGTYYKHLSDALASENVDDVTLLADDTLSEDVMLIKDIFFYPKGHTVSGEGAIVVPSGKRLVLNKTGNAGAIRVEDGGTLMVDEGFTGTVQTLTVSETADVKLSGGMYGTITGSRQKAGTLLNYNTVTGEKYFAFQKQDGTFARYDQRIPSETPLENVTVVGCPDKQLTEACGETCEYCGGALRCRIGAAGYRNMSDAIRDVPDGGTITLLRDYSAVTNISANVDRAYTIDLNGHSVRKNSGGISLAVYAGTPKIIDSKGGGVIAGLEIDSKLGLTLADLLPEGYTFKSGSAWISDLSGTELTNVSMAKITIKSMDYPTKMSMTYGGTGTLLVNVKKETGTGAVSFQWYKVEDGKETAVGGATTKNQFDLSALKLSAGNHTFRFLATCDGYEKMSKDIAVTVQKADIRSITPPTAQENLTYTGHEQALITAGSVADYGTMQYSLTENGTYSQNIPVGTDAGTYTVWYRVIGDTNHNDTAPASMAVNIGKKPLTITGVTAASKPYDGTTNADISSVTFDNVTLNRDTDYTVTASFDDASAGNGKNVTATVTLMEQAAKNYALEQSSFPTTGNITKIAVPDFTKETALVIVNDYANTYTVTLPALPKLETPKEYGAPTYELGDIKLNAGYYTSGAKVENGELTLPIQKNDVETTGPVGTVTVVIKSANYEDITLTVNVNATNKLVPTVTAPTANTLTYNGAEQALVTAGQTTGGTMLYRLNNSEWSEQIPTAKNAEEYTVWYKVQGNAEYADVAEQRLPVTVAKKAVTVTALNQSAYTGSTAPDLSSPKADKDYKVEGLVGADTLSGTVTLAYAQTPDMSKTGKTAINITGTLSNNNYEITYVSGTLTVSNQPSGGGGGVVTPAPTPADADVITVKGDNKDNTNAKPGAETGTTTTKTTVKHTTTATTKNEQGQEVSKTTASVSKDLGDKLLDQAVSNKSDTIEITVKSNETNNNGSGAGASAADSVKATEVELPKATVNAIAKDTNADLVIKTDNGEVVLDNKTLETIADAAKGDTVTIVVGENTQLKETQKPAEKIVGKNGTLFDLAAKIGERLLHQFEGGKAHVTLPMPEKLKGKDVLVIYIDDNGLCKILNHSVEKIGAEDYIRFTTTHFSTFAVVDKGKAERPMKEQNAAHVKELMQSAKFKVTTTKTSKKSVKVQVAAKSSKTLLSDIKSLGYTVKYQFYRSTKKTAGYKLRKTSSKNSFISTKGTKGRKYYYKARVLVYDGKKLVAKSALGQCSYGARTWTK